KETFKDYTEEEIEGMCELMNALSLLFLNDNYIVTSFLAHYYIYTKFLPRPDIFIYPSVQTNNKSVNFAVHPNTVVEKLNLKRVFKLKVTEINHEKHSFGSKILSIGKNEEGNILWRSPS